MSTMKNPGRRINNPRPGGIGGVSSGPKDVLFLRKFSVQNLTVHVGPINLVYAY